MWQNCILFCFMDRQQETLRTTYLHHIDTLNSIEWPSCYLRLIEYFSRPSYFHSIDSTSHLKFFISAIIFARRGKNKLQKKTFMVYDVGSREKLYSCKEVLLFWLTSIWLTWIWQAYQAAFLKIVPIFFSKFLHSKNRVYQWNMQKNILSIFLTMKATILDTHGNNV